MSELQPDPISIGTRQPFNHPGIFSQALDQMETLMFCSNKQTKTLSLFVDNCLVGTPERTEKKLSQTIKKI